MELKITDISKSFTSTTGERIEALRHISFTASEGRFICIIGPSGCGKTTLLRIISGLEPSGKDGIRLGERELSSPTNEIGYIFQEPTLFPWRTLLKNVEFGLEIAGVEKHLRRQRAMAALELVELQDFGDFYPKEISGGMKQRVALAMALVVEPKVLLMDEPFASLDCQTRNHMQAALLRIWEKTGKTVIFVTHNVEEAAFLGDEIICLTSRPAQIKKVVKVPLSRPRDRTSPELNTIRKEILTFLEEERKAGRLSVGVSD